MMQHYHDAIAICRVMGPADFFVTFTCNLSKSGIINELPTWIMLRGSPRSYNSSFQDKVTTVA